MSTERIAKIRKTFLGIEDHGIFTATLDLDYGGAGQGTPAYCFKGTGPAEDPRALDFIARLIAVCGVRSWEEIPGRTVVAEIEDGLVIGLHPLPTEKGKSFLFTEIYPRLTPAGAA